MILYMNSWRIFEEPDAHSDVSLLSVARGWHLDDLQGILSCKQKWACPIALCTVKRPLPIHFKYAPKLARVTGPLRQPATDGDLTSHKDSRCMPCCHPRTVQMNLS